MAIFGILQFSILFYKIFKNAKVNRLRPRAETTRGNINIGVVTVIYNLKKSEQKWKTSYEKWVGPKVYWKVSDTLKYIDILWCECVFSKFFSY